VWTYIVIAGEGEGEMIRATGMPRVEGEGRVGVRTLNCCCVWT